MRSIISVLLLVFLLGSSALALPLPGVPQIEYGCGSVNLHWTPPDAGQYQLQGYLLYKSINGQQNWQLLNQDPSTDTTYIDQDLTIGTLFCYGVRAAYAEGQSDLCFGNSEFLPDPASVDYLLVGNGEEQELNDWYAGYLNQLGLSGATVKSVLPYCGIMLQNLRLLWYGGQGPYRHGYDYGEQHRAIAEYLNTGGRLYVDDGNDIGSDSLAYQMLGFGYTNCMPYPFQSVHGVAGTFTEGLWYQFPDTLFSSNMAPLGGPEVRVVLEDDVQCGCVDLAVEKNGFKAVINSQPLQGAIDNEVTGTRLEYFRRMLQYFDILSAVDDPIYGALPEQISLTAYPNPFNAQVTLALSDVGEISIYDISGRLVRTMLVTHNSSIIWDGRNDQGAPVTSGVYFAKATAGDKTASIKLTLLK